MAEKTEKKWQAALQHLRVAIERLVQNFSAQTGVSRKVAAGHVERIARDIREHEEKKKTK